MNKDDVLIVVSHGDQNAVPAEVAQAAKRDGLYVIALTSKENHENRKTSHSSGKRSEISQTSFSIIVLRRKMLL